MSQGIIIKKFRADNRIFNSEAFERNVEENSQRITFSGVGAQHQNAVAERAIGVVQNMACAMLLHPRVRWPDEFDPSLWPFALSYAVWICNHLPHSDRANMSAERRLLMYLWWIVTITSCSRVRVPYLCTRPQVTGRKEDPQVGSMSKNWDVSWVL